jgi:N-methylhydantoinase A
VTDADLVLGYLNPVALLDGALPVDRARAAAAIEREIARPLGVALEDAAAAIIDVVDASMAAALRIVSVERGFDAREFSLVAFGGAGPVHAARLADELEIPRVIVPPIPGGFSALGLVASDLRRDYAKTFYAALASASLADLGAAYAELEASARAMLRAHGVPESRGELARAADVRYSRQAYELTVPVTPGPVTRATVERLAADFHDKHRATYGHAIPGEPVQLVTLRLTARGRQAGLDLARAGSDRRGMRGAPASGRAPRPREAHFKETGRVHCDVIGRDALGPGHERRGPLIVEAMDTTVVVPPGWRVQADGRGFLIMERTRA